MERSLFGAVLQASAPLEIHIPEGQQLALTGAALGADAPTSAAVTLLVSSKLQQVTVAVCTLRAQTSTEQWSTSLVASETDSPLRLTARGKGAIHLTGNWRTLGHALTEKQEEKKPPSSTAPKASVAPPPPAPPPELSVSKRAALAKAAQTAATAKASGAAPAKAAPAAATATASGAGDSEENDENDDDDEDDAEGGDVDATDGAQPLSKAQRKAKRRKQLAERKKRKLAECGVGCDDDDEAQRTENGAAQIVVRPRRRRLADGFFVTDTAIGSGPTPRRGQRCAILYEGTLADAATADEPDAGDGGDGRVFDSRLNRRKPLRFRLGLREVVSGLDRGLEGMRAGGRRTIVVPPALGYGVNGRDTAVPADATLVFSVELVEIS